MRNRLAALVVAATVVTPAAVAVAAESSLPGELLYPVKQVTEDVRSVVDSTVVARHRLDEADAMLSRGFPVDEVAVVLVEADSAITNSGDHPDLRSRWSEMQDHMVTDTADNNRSGVPHDEFVPPRDDVDEMRDGTNGPTTDEMPSQDGTNHDRPEGTHDNTGSDMGSDMGNPPDGNPDMSPGSDIGTIDTGTGPVDGSGGTMTEEMPGDAGTGSVSDEMPGDAGSGTPTEGSGMDADSGPRTGSGRDGNG